MRILIEALGRKLLEIRLLEPAPVPEVPGQPDALAHDPRGTIAAQVEGAYEPPVGFGLAAKVEARDGRADRAG